MDYFEKLPEEISLEILTRLPTESVLDSKLVCRNWRKIISHHPWFSKKHLHHLNRPSAESAGKLGFLVATHERLHYFEYGDDQSTKPIQRIKKINLKTPFQQFRLIGSCNGLICLLPLPQIHPSICICNPITREYLILPEINRDYDSYTDGYDCGETCFAFISSTNEYQIVRFFQTYKTFFEVHIYTLGSGNGWRYLGEFYCGSKSLEHRVVFVNGALHWLNNVMDMICTFDVAEEKFGEHHFPSESDSGHSYFSIGVLHGFLLFAVEKFGIHHDIWLLKKKNHDKKEGEEHQSLSWTKEFRIEEDTIILAFTKSDGVLNCRPYGLYIYYTKTSTWKKIVKFNSPIAQASPHTNTFVSLIELGEEAVEVMESAQIEETKTREQPHEDAEPDYIYM